MFYIQYNKILFNKGNMGCSCKKTKINIMNNETKNNIIDDCIKSEENKEDDNILPKFDTEYIPLISLNNLLYFRENLNFVEIKSKLKNSKDSSFNFPEIDIYIGEGYRRIKGYLSRVNLFQLNNLRKEFWESRVEGKIQIWKQLRKICENQNISDKGIKKFFEYFGFIPLYDTINICVDLNKNIYEIPNYCIHDPYKYELEEDYLLNIKKPSSKEIEIHIFDSNKKVTFSINNHDSVFDLKIDVLNHEEFKKYNGKFIHLLLNGEKLHDNKELWKYNIDDGTTLELFVDFDDENNSNNLLIENKIIKKHRRKGSTFKSEESNEDDNLILNSCA